jgi:hypothetical protein
MADNLKDFAISATESRDMIKKQMVGGELGPDAIAGSLERSKELSKSGYLSFQDRRQAVSDLTGGMAASGASGADAQAAAENLVDMFSGNQKLKGIAADAFSNTFDNTAGQATMLNLAGIAPSTDSGDWGAQLAQNGGAATQRALNALARMAAGNKGQFRMLLQNVLGLNISQDQANELLKSISSGGGSNEASAAAERVDGAGTGVQERSMASRTISGIGSVVSMIGGGIADLVTGNASNIPGRTREADFEGQSQHIPVLDKIVQQNGGDPNNIMVEGAGGWEKLQPKNEEQLAALAAGGKWRRASDPADSQGYTLNQAATMSNFGKQEVAVQGQVSLHVTSDPGVRVQAPKVFGLTQNQMQANAGYNGASVNNAPPGDR